MGIFIRISADENAITPELARKLTSLCPVDIYGVDDERLVMKPEQEDECILCRLCLDAAPAGALAIHKLYKNESLVSTGQPTHGN
jgi:NAD-dependent dihydropyrimidine dehydrogenase PreA subunit